MDTNKKSSEKSPEFICSICDYFTCSSKDFNKHCSTQKHKRLTNANELSKFSPKNPQIYKCICGNVYKHMSSLCKHKKTCNLTNDEKQK